MKKKNINVVPILALVISLLIVITIGVIHLYPMKPDKLFEQSIQSIVELKAVSENSGESYGTAVCIESSDVLVTNAHVVTYSKMGENIEFDEYYIRIADEEEYRKVSLEKYDLNTDIAVLKVDDPNINLKPIKIGDSDKLSFGDKVYAIGNGSNYGLALTQGIISMPKINIKYEETMREVIQSDITIASGNSGGALLDEKGRLVGITSFRTKDNQGNIVYGLVYSIPVNMIVEYANP